MRVSLPHSLTDRIITLAIDHAWRKVVPHLAAAAFAFAHSLQSEIERRRG